MIDLKAMPDAHQPLLPLTETDLIAARRAERAQEQRAIEKGRALWPDIRPESEKRDISDITRDIARST